MDGRLPAHLEVGGIVRAVESAGGFAAIVQRGERDAGNILILTMERGKNAALWERMAQMDGSRRFVLSREQHTENPKEFDEYVARRGRADPDCWIVELDVSDAERFVDSGEP